MGIKEIRAAIDFSLDLKKLGQATIIFVDEVHRFNKGHSDAFLTHVKSGLITFLGAKTENPAFEVNNALLSRSAVYQFKLLCKTELMFMINRAAELSDCTIDCAYLIADFAAR